MLKYVVLSPSCLLVFLGLLTEVRGAQKEPQAISNAQLRQALNVLQSIKLTLKGADHDYGGHRVKAIADISKAQNQLNLALKNAPKKKGKGKGKSNPLPEPQALSDAQLLESMVFLKETVQLLGKANHDYGGHRAAAVEDLHRAIRQLDLALKFRKGKV
ncbi:MAG TPA: hypothetical protein VKE98_18800 [Gemmataceae bacterium]|nr:hypothetical protein [Gemmataceae bacterium]